MSAMNNRALQLSGAVLLMLTAGTTTAHHSHALFDLSRSVSVSGTVAKLDWSNPHIRQQKTGYRLYAFESGSVALMARAGWDHDVLKPGQKLTVDYMPLRDGRPGGSLLKLTLADGRSLTGDPLIVRAHEAQLQGTK
jgi:hypothetical protein